MGRAISSELKAINQIMDILSAQQPHARQRVLNYVNQWSVTYGLDEHEAHPAGEVVEAREAPALRDTLTAAEPAPLQ